MVLLSVLLMVVPNRMLEEVVSDGTANQKARAQQLLDKLTSD